MYVEKPTIVLVHGAFAESGTWNAVIERLLLRRLDVVAVANPLRSLAGDAAYVRDVIAGIGKPVVVVGHSYGGMVITEAAASNPAVRALVYVAAYAPKHGESAVSLTESYSGSTLGNSLIVSPVADGGKELLIRQHAFHMQFAADVPYGLAKLMAVTQRPVTQAALMAGLATRTPAWQHLPSWFVFGDRDMSIPVAALRYEAQRAGSRGTQEVAGASHAVYVSNPDAVADVILQAVEA